MVDSRRINANRREMIKGNFPICHAFVFETGSHCNHLAPTDPERGFRGLGFDRFQVYVRVFVTSVGTLDLYLVCLVVCACLWVKRSLGASADTVI